MKKILLMVFVYVYGETSIIHEKPDYFIQYFPIVLEVILTEDEVPQKVQIFYKNPLEKEFKISAMDCNSTHCKTIIPAQTKEYFRYFIKLKLCSGKVIESSSITIKMKPLPSWQQDIDIQDKFINVYGKDRELKGFILDRVLFRENIDVLIKPNKKIIENKEDNKKSWWNSFIFWGDNDEDKEIDKNSKDQLPQEYVNEMEYLPTVEEISTNRDNSNYREIFTP